MAVINGTIFDDTLRGTEANDSIYGLGGDDVIFGNGGDETLYGGEGDDYLVSGYGPAGIGVSRLYGGAGSDEFGGGAGSDLSYGGDGTDYFSFSGGQDSIYGGQGSDILLLYAYNRAVNFTLGSGGSGTVTIRAAANLGFTGVTNYFGIEGLGGGSFNDTLHGNISDNTLVGNAGADSLFGMAGNDALYGGEGHDTLTGGRGRDIFAFEGEADRHLLAADADVLTDYDVAQDSLVFFSRNFTGLRTASDTADGLMGDTQIFDLLAQQFVVQNSRAAMSTSVRLIYDRDDGLLYYDADGALSGHRAILIADIGKDLALTAADFFIY